MERHGGHPEGWFFAISTCRRGLSWVVHRIVAIPALPTRLRTYIRYAILPETEFGGGMVAVDQEALRVSALPATHVAALQDAAVLLTGFAYEATGEIHRGIPMEDTWLAEYLPARYRSRYDETFARQFVTCVVTASARLWSDEPFRPSCVAEQLAFCALLDFAQATLEDRGLEPEFGPAWERAFDDLGVKTLFDATHAVEPRL